MPEAMWARPQGRKWIRRTVGACLLGGGLLAAGCQPIVPPTPVGDASAAAPVVHATAAMTATAIAATADVSATASLFPAVEAASQVSATATPSATAPRSPAAPALDPALIAAGLAVYRQQYCGVCHELVAAGTRGTFGPTHNGIGTTAAQRIHAAGYTGHATTAEGYLRESLLEPQAYIVEGYGATPHRMPPYGHLDSASLDALVAFLLSQQ